MGRGSKGEEIRSSVCLEVKKNKIGGCNGLVGEFLKYVESGMILYTSTVICSSLARGVCYTAVKRRLYS